MEKEFELKYKLTKAGKSMYTLTCYWTKIMLKNKLLYYILSLTWGLPTTLLGLLLSLILLPFTKKKKYYWIYYHECFGNDWGGFSLGLTAFKDKDQNDEYITEHEFGHTFQNTLLGPFFLFLVAIPSATRYWYQTIRDAKHKPNKDYDAIWFEAAATNCGKYATKYLYKDPFLAGLMEIPDEVLNKIYSYANDKYTLRKVVLKNLISYSFIENDEVVFIFGVDMHKKKLALAGQVYKIEKGKLKTLVNSIEGKDE